MTEKPVIGIIGGSGLEDPAFIDDYQEIRVSTPYGEPGSNLIRGKIAGVPVVILSRHGKSHTINPTQVNYRANIYALKKQGCTHILATTACGSLRETIAPGDFVFPDQFIDQTTQRNVTFFDGTNVQHVPMGTPFCARTRTALVRAADRLGLKAHTDKTVVTIEGPRFSTKAESNLFRSWGGDIINMSTFPEVSLAREMGICYQSIAMSTDYDCWRKSEEAVTMEMIFQNMAQNANHVKKLIKEVIPHLVFEDCTCQTFYNALPEKLRLPE